MNGCRFWGVVKSKCLIHYSKCQSLLVSMRFKSRRGYHERMNTGYASNPRLQISLNEYGHCALGSVVALAEIAYKQQTRLSPLWKLRSDQHTRTIDKNFKNPIEDQVNNDVSTLHASTNDIRSWIASAIDKESIFVRALTCVRTYICVHVRV